MSEAVARKSLGDIIVQALDLAPDDEVEVLRDKLDGNRILVVRIPKKEIKSEVNSQDLQR